MIDAALSAITGQTLFRLALWNDAGRARIGDGLGAALPGPCRSIMAGTERLLWLEDRHWLVACANADAAAVLNRVQGLVGDDGTVTEVGAALVGRCITGTGWRELLMIGGVFDAENPGFGPGSVARTIMHHSPLLIDVVAETRVHAYVPASYAGEFFAFWDAELARAHG
ncbi:MAG: hypothetical protein H7268_01050 [Sandarakinorhabdus sp.]|nr:hypothetical protein [Sandarakinorhabdus sp.]